MQIEKLEKALPEVFQKLEKLNYDLTLADELKWCVGSYKYDANPEGVIEKGGQVVQVLKSAKEKNSRSVSQKLIESLERALA
ncbi:hypothetical protein PBT90_03140 [Algoriphagus halophytocola]|uniref:Uncharacterized protein n=1 Tax=Algoriphagus halophytocola TaxID=2991499 RepID=A0ABY6MGV9_9BACT|nr:MULTISPECIES: hypothetical protein [unclassified Algoriphagus]UZD22423.1 hypothetical protein OM944_17420 [Algoriphagus sp. TR-M5]WBL43683.1 hypothetical protein PBT90_03140 [Algoriphagus sp. TR-M9]